jgi:uncharacterized protein YlxW (UPF0749 family)
MGEEREFLIRALQHKGEYGAASEIQNLQAERDKLQARVTELEETVKTAGQDRLNKYLADVAAHRIL